MSFIYENDKLIRSLIEAGEASFKKQAQAKDVDTATLEKAIPDYELAVKLLYNLQRDLGDPAAPPAGIPIGVEGGGDASGLTANTANFRTLGDFLQWAAAKKLTWKGKRFAWAPKKAPATPVATTPPPKTAQTATPAAAPVDDQTPPDSAWIFTSLPFDRNDRAIDRQPNPETAYADKDALMEYLAALRDGPDAKSNKVLQFMLATLIGEANGYLRIAGEKPISPKPSEKPQDNLDPRMVVDMVPEVLDPDNFQAGLNNHPFQNASPDDSNALTVGDLKTEGAFKGWLRNRKVKSTTPATAATANQPAVAAKTEVVSADPTNQKSDPCLAIHLLYKRALTLKNVAAGDDKEVPNYSKAAALYLQSVTDFGKTLTNKDGQPCAVVTPGAAQPTAPGQPTTPGAQVDVKRVLQEMADDLPLDPNDIDFNRIRTFFNQFRKILQSSTNEGAGPANQYMNDAELAINKAQKLTTGGLAPINMATDPRGIANMIQKPAVTYYTSFLQLLELVIDHTGRAVDSFYSLYGKQMEPSLRSLVEAQSRGGNSYVMRNKTRIQSLIARRAEVASFV